MAKDLNPACRQAGQNGVSLIITFFIMIIILSVVLSLSIILYSEIKVLRNMGNSVISFYAADSGIEKVLYYDRQVIEPATVTNPTNPTRGLCSIFDSTNNPSSCQSGSGANNSIYCNNQQNPVSTDCVVSSCGNCSISFTTNLDDINGSPVIYTVTASVNTNYYLDITAKGGFGSTVRQTEAYSFSRY